MKPVRKHTAALNLPTLQLEGGLFLPDMLEKAALGQARMQTEADYGIPKGLKLKDEYSRSFQIACAQWRGFAPLLERVDVDAQHATTTFVTELLRDAFGYTAVNAIPGITLEDRHYPISLLAPPSGVGSTAHAIPIVVVPHTLGLDDADTRFAIQGSGSRKKTPFQLAQELLNASPDHQWAIVTNGKTLRLLRDAATLTRPSYLDIDLQDLLSGQRFAEFAYAWRLLHASRAGLVSGTSETPAPVVWESWREAGQEEGTRVRDGLRLGVTEALITLGQGFLQHPGNEALRLALQDGSLSQSAYFAQLLRLIYRFIFVFSVEERGLIPNAPQPQDDPATARAKLAAAQAYAQGYALSRLRDMALRRRARTKFDDLWQCIKIVFKGLAQGETRLGLPALGGLFAPTQCRALDGTQLTNADLLAVMQSLRWAKRAGGPLAPIDYRNMDTEELGSVYESLLELVPEVDLHARSFGFVGITSVGSTAGNDRKLTGSYYTPDSLVKELIKSALDPVITQRLAANPAIPVDALLAIRVIDPACGSGHFLLAAARRLAERLASLRSPDGAVTPLAYRHALREVIGRCIFGVDRNPMAVELARTALWLEGFEEGRPLSFLDHHLQCGDALLGLIDLKTLELGIAKDAFKPLSGDDKEVCKQLAKINTAALKDLVKKRNARAFGQLDVASAVGNGLRHLQAIEALPDNTTQEIADKEVAYRAFLEQAKTSRLAHAADLLVGAYLLTKREGAEAHIPTSATLYLTLLGDALPMAQQGALSAAQAACVEARVLHWPLAFPQVFASGGFDCVLGNPPWERIKLQEEEFFATRHRDVFEAKNKAERSQRIQWLSEGKLAKHLFPQVERAPHDCEAEQRLYAEFIIARRTAEAASVFAHVKGEDGGRFPLTGVGDVNTYALFAETISQITNTQGRSGFIVPTGIATDDGTKAYFAHHTQQGRLISIHSFENEKFIFPDVHHSFRFCMLTLGMAEQAEFVFFAQKVEQIHDPRRRFRLTPDEFKLISPNSLTCPVLRSEMDAELTKKLYRAVPILIDDNKPGGNTWGLRFHSRLFHMAEDSHHFRDSSTPERLALYEAKMIHHYDHRWATYGLDSESHDVSVDQKMDPNFTVSPRYWVEAKEVEQRLSDRGWSRNWLMGWRDITSAHVLRTVIATVMPRLALGNTVPFLMSDQSPKKLACLIANLSALVLDFVARVKVGGTHLTYGYLKQFPILPPDRYTDTNLAFINSRVLELTYTAHDLLPWAQDLDYHGEPFAFNPERRATLRAELDAYYSKLYGLTRDELCYILDPADIMGEDYPSETFRVLKNKEQKELGEYRTQRLVLREFDRMTLADASGQLYQSLLVPPPGEQAQHSYSSHGVIKDEADAHLIGLLLTMVRQQGHLPRRHLTDAMAMVAQPASWPKFVDAQGVDLINTLQQQHPGIFEAQRLTGARIQNWLRYLESTGAIRVESLTGDLVAVQGAAIPGGVVADEETGRVATLLNLAAAQIAVSTTTRDEQTTEVAVKRA
ncbi:N-6 DNA methylase [Rhodoferax sp. U2-2l]|uniref:Eco57I restriction-modification methylase domain-containing protein n=1 Tax=Rhodoferax sp. U2-2l TaxID=2884000 RepID=UPI001D0AD423|nr:N-6 DNA methylase [Rhodoferax sp. U2-2l]MCB8747285.1 N-6 DNA methylase [Rhodoferax sp. U2-2l]